VRPFPSNFDHMCLIHVSFKGSANRDDGQMQEIGQQVRSLHSGTFYNFISMTKKDKN